MFVGPVLVPYEPGSKLGRIAVIIQDYSGSLLVEGLLKALCQEFQPHLAVPCSHILPALVLLAELDLSTEQA